MTYLYIRTVEDNDKKKLVSKKIKGVLEGDKEDLTKKYLLGQQVISDFY